MELGLKDKVAIVTGGGEGIGRAAAHRIAAEGGNVLIVGRRRDVIEQSARDLASQVSGTIIPVQRDITEHDAAGAILKAAVDRFGGVDILVNNAGRSMAKTFEAVSRSEWDEDFDVKLWAAIALIQAVIPSMRERGGGRIINVTNLDGRTPRASTMPTSVARAAGIALTKGLSKDLAADNILVNTVCIGFIKSGQHERRYRRVTGEHEPDFNRLYAEEAVRRGVPLARVGEGREAGDVIAFLVSERASYITGVAINIDGGTSAVV